MKVGGLKRGGRVRRGVMVVGGARGGRGVVERGEEGGESLLLLRRRLGMGRGGLKGVIKVRRGVDLVGV